MGRGSRVLRFRVKGFGCRVKVSVGGHRGLGFEEGVGFRVEVCCFVFFGLGLTFFQNCAAGTPDSIKSSPLDSVCVIRLRIFAFGHGQGLEFDETTAVEVIWAVVESKAFSERVTCICRESPARH